MQKLCRSGMKANERETTTHIRELDRDLGNILISSSVGNARSGEEVQNDQVRSGQVILFHLGNR